MSASGGGDNARTVAPAGTPRQYRDADRTVTFVPLAFRRRQHRKLVIAPTVDVAADIHVDLPMLKMLGKAFYWDRLVEEGVVPTGRELARRLKLDAGWVNETRRLARLAPDIVQSIVEGRQPRELNVHVLRGRASTLPRGWAEQREMLGFAPQPTEN